MGRANSWGLWLQGLGGPKAGVSLLVGGEGSQDHWLRDPGCPRAGVGLLVDRDGTQLVLRLCQPTGGWDQGPGDPRVGAHPLVGEGVARASAGPLMDGARSQDL